MLPKIVDDFVNLFYPTTCFACSTPLVSGEEKLCISCLATLPYTDYHVLKENKVARTFVGRVPFEDAASLLHFYKGGKTQALLHQLKYKNQPELGIYLGKLAATYYKEEGFFQHIQGLLPVPLHPDKLAKRGYNQATQLAKGMACIWGIPVIENALVRTTATSTQTKKNRFERWLNVETVFEISNSSSLAHKHLLLIDDVLTTGATLEACAVKLLAVNGVNLSMFTLAHAE
jgi:ComF family protein